MYHAFAEVYDAFMEDVPYSQWCVYIEKLLENHGVIPPSAIIDMACGTGNIAIPLAKRGFQVLAADQSEEMLQIAGVKARKAGAKIGFIQATMQEFCIFHPVCAITCMCDAVNYLNESDCMRFFHAAYDALKPGGVLLFDVSTPHRLFEELGENTFAEEQEDKAYILVTHVQEQKALIMELTMFIQQSEDSYTRRYEEHILYAHPQHRLQCQLKEAGFSAVDTFAFLTESALQPHHSRAMWVAQK